MVSPVPPAEVREAAAIEHSPPRMSIPGRTLRRPEPSRTADLLPVVDAIRADGITSAL
jgi:hypothetical protein